MLQANIWVANKDLKRFPSKLIIGRRKVAFTVVLKFLPSFLDSTARRSSKVNSDILPLYFGIL